MKEKIILSSKETVDDIEVGDIEVSDFKENEPDYFFERVEGIKSNLEFYRKLISDLKEIDATSGEELDTGEEDALQKEAESKISIELEKDVERLKKSIIEKKEAINVIFKKVSKIDSDMSIQGQEFDPSDLKINVINFKSLFSKGIELEAEVQKETLEYSVFKKKYIEKKLVNLGAKEGEDFFDLRHKKTQEKIKLEGFLNMGSFFKKNEISDIDNQLKDLSGLLEFDMYDGVDGYHKTLRPYIVDGYIEKIQKVVHNLNTKSIVDMIELISLGTDSKEKVLFSKEQIDRLRDRYFEYFLMPKFEKAENLSSEEDKKTVLDYIKKSLDFNKNIYSNTVSEQERVRNLKFKGEIGKLDYGLRNKVEQYWPEKAISSDINNIGLLIDNADLKERKCVIDSLIDDFNTTVGPYNYFYRYGVLNDPDSFSSAPFDDLTKGVNVDILKTIENDRGTLEFLGEGKVNKMKDFLVKNLVENNLLNLYSSTENLTESIYTGRKLMEIGDPKYSVQIILNAFGLKGYNCDYPLIKNHHDKTGNTTESSDLINYIKNLSDEDLEKIETPGFIELITFLKHNPKKAVLFFHSTDYLSPEEITDKEFINENIIKVLRHEIKNSPFKNLNFYFRTAESIDSDLSGLYSDLISDIDKYTGKFGFLSDLCHHRIYKFKDMDSIRILDCMNQENKGSINISKIFTENSTQIISFLQDDKNSWLKDVILQSASDDILSEDESRKSQAIIAFAGLGENVGIHQDFIVENIFKKTLLKYNALDREGDLILKYLEKDLFKITKEQSVDICEIVKNIMLMRLDHYSYIFKIVTLLHDKNNITDEYYNDIHHVFELSSTNSQSDIESLIQEGVTEENWAKMISRHALIDADLMFVPEEVRKNMTELFSNNHPDNRDFCLKKLHEQWRAFLDTEKIGTDAYFIGNICEKSEGMGGLKYIENISYMIYYMDKYNNSKGANKKTRDSLFSGLQSQENRFVKEKWSEEDKSFFYSISKDILAVSPSLYTDFFKVFEKLDQRDMKFFNREYFASYQALLIVLNKGNGNYDGREIVLVRKQIEGLIDKINNGEKTKDVFEEARVDIVSMLKEKFVSRFGISSVPENFNSENIKILESLIKYTANINNKDDNKEAVLAFYLGVSLNGDWQKMKRGIDINPEDYLTGKNLVLIKEILSKRDPFEFINSVNLGIDKTELPMFMKILEDETVSSTIGNIETVDIRLGNIKRAIFDLEDIDAYEHEEDRLILELFKKEGKLVNAALSKMFSEVKGGAALSEKENDIKRQLSSVYKIESWSQGDVKKIQESIRGISLIHGILEKIDVENIDDKIFKLQNDLNPDDEIISIFLRLDESFKNNSGAVALSEDLIYLENIIIKNQDKITEKEGKKLAVYLDNIRGSMKVLEETVDNIKDYFEKLKKSVHGSGKVRLQERLSEIEKIIYSSNKSVNLVSRMTGNISDVIVNIRQCLGCLSPQCNNDTNLTFGEPYKFLMLSQNGLEKDSIADQIVMCVPTAIEGGEKTLSFVLDTVYGVKSSDVLFGNINTINKKIRALKNSFPEIKISISVSESSLSSVGLSNETFINRCKKEYPELVSKHGEIKADIPKSKMGDNYAEYGGGVRPFGVVDFKGVVMM